MPSTSIIKSISNQGLEGCVVDVECHLSNSLPGINIIGVASKSVDEAKERLRGAFSNSDLQMPKKRITVNLAPADIPKEGSGFDLSIALSIMAATNTKISEIIDHGFISIGELSLNGDIKPIRGVVGKIIAAKKLGYKKFIIADGNKKQASLVPDIELFPFKNLKDLIIELNQDSVQQKPLSNPYSEKYDIQSRHHTRYNHDGTDFSDVNGQSSAKRALEIAATGQHNILLSGAPGTGKSMLAKAFVSILPDMDRGEILEVTQIHSLSTQDFSNIVTKRPFRSPHHTASVTSIIGGGTTPRPGEISLAHNGILFLDELPEFPRSILETLRQPLEDGEVNVSRTKGKVCYPAKFILVATKNPCPCGYFGTDKECVCTPSHINQYNKKISGPLLDRIDLYIDVDSVDHKTLLRSNHSETSDTIRDRVISGRQLQFNRQQGILNGQLTGKNIKSFSNIDTSAKNLIDKAAGPLNLSARGYMRTIRVARTIADLDRSKSIKETHIAEALQYRPTIIKF